MRKILALSALAVSAILLSRCSPKTGSAVTKTEMSPAEKVADVKKNYTAAQMEEGHQLWSTNCNKCHKLHDGPEFSVDKWERVLPRMSKRAKLDEAQAGKVRAYLLANAKMD